MSWGASFGSAWANAWGDGSAPPPSSGRAWGNSWGSSWGDSWGVGEPPAPPIADDTHDGYWHKQWLKLRKKPEPPTVAEVVEIVKESPQVVEVVRAEVERKYPQVDYAAIMANVQLQRFIARQLIEAAQEEDDLEVLLLA